MEEERELGRPEDRDYPEGGDPDDFTRHVARRVLGLALSDGLRVSHSYKGLRKTAWGLLVSYKPASVELRAFWCGAAGIRPDYVRAKSILAVYRRVCESGVNIGPSMTDRWGQVIRLAVRDSSHALSGSSTDPEQSLSRPSTRVWIGSDPLLLDTEGSPLWSNDRI